MATPIDASRFRAAAGRFRAFFEELNDAFVERHDVLEQVALALLCREHVLLTGPPGTAKSRVASAVFNRILCEERQRPSLYARQITESTVQTDLIGPVDFKTLMETGRTEHFTDEGMLGAHHAFLDEIFDGRDMLLRSALNVLQERELKQGTRTSTGRIECAILTTNRYIADVLEHSRETLLAFVDRIAFVGFVPRGFSKPEQLERVLRREVGGTTRPSLDALLTVQDLDVLQAAVDQVFVSRSACVALAQMIGHLDQELASAVRSDPTFFPTRYLSTRTAVRAGRVLRAACVLDRITKSDKRPLQVLKDDFGALRLHLVLAGPTPPEAAELLKKEVDPDEKRQLTILRTEREIFDRVLEKVPAIRRESFADPFVEREAPSASPAEAGAATRASDPAPAHDPERLACEAIEAKYGASTESGDSRAVLAAVRELMPIAREQSRRGETAQRLLAAGLRRLHEHAMRAVLMAEGDHDRALVAPVLELARFAADVDDTSVALHDLARWLRERAGALLEELALLWPGVGAAGFFEASSAAELFQRSRSRIAGLRELLELHQRLVRSDAEAPGATSPEGATEERLSPGWSRAVDGLVAELAALWESLFCRAVEQVLAAPGQSSLGQVIGGVREELSLLKTLATELDALRGSPSGLVQRAVGARVGQLIRALLQRTHDRATLHNEIDAVLALLADAQLEAVVPTSDWLAWAAVGLLRSERNEARGDASPEPSGLEGYRRLRDVEQRTPLTYVLCEVALRVAPPGPEPIADLTAIAELLSDLPVELRSELASMDLGRIERATTYLERWWGDATSDPEVEANMARVQQGVLGVLWDEGALARFSLEAKLLGDLLPDQEGAARALRARLTTLADASRAGAVGLLRAETEQRWARALAG